MPNLACTMFQLVPMIASPIWHILLLDKEALDKPAEPNMGPQPAIDNY